MNFSIVAQLLMTTNESLYLSSPTMTNNAQLLMTTNESLYLSSPTMTNNPICMKEKRRFFYYIAMSIESKRNTMFCFLIVPKKDIFQRVV